MNTMTTQAHSDLAYQQAQYYFGKDVAHVIRALYNYDQASLKLLKYQLPKTSMADLKKALLISVKYQLVDYVRTTKNFNQQFEYSVTPDRIPCFFRLPKYIEMVCLSQGPLAGKIVQILAEKALLSREKLAILSYDREKSTDTQNLKQVVDCLVEKRYIVQTSNNLCINLERLDRQYRDDLITEAIYNFYNCDSKVKSLSKAILEISRDNTAGDATVTSPVPLADISRDLVPTYFKSIVALEKYLLRLTTEKNNRFFICSGSHPQKGAMYALCIGLMTDYLVKEHLCSVITTRFGPKCCRVFRVLLQRGPLLLKQIEEIIMLPARDVREYSYMLIKEGLIRNRQVPKTPDNAPGKSVFIMSVELDQVVYSFADLCCRSMSNLLIRHDFELRRNESLLARSKAVQELLDSGSQSTENPAKPEASADDWNQYFNSHELNQINQVNKTIVKLVLAKNQVDDTLYLFYSWLRVRPNMDYDGF